MRFALIMMLVACGGGGKGGGARGESGGLCFEDGRCNPGLVCIDRVCGTLDGAVPGDTVSMDAPSGACADDSVIEPNDTPQTAFVTPVDTGSLQVSFSSLAICPSGDKDHFRITSS